MRRFLSPRALFRQTVALVPVPKLVPLLLLLRCLAGRMLRRLQTERSVRCDLLWFQCRFRCWQGRGLRFHAAPCLLLVRLSQVATPVAVQRAVPLQAVRVAKAGAVQAPAL
jgi:hypothetical protein